MSSISVRVDVSVLEVFQWCSDSLAWAWMIWDCGFWSAPVCHSSSERVDDGWISHGVDGDEGVLYFVLSCVRYLFVASCSLS